MKGSLLDPRLTFEDIALLLEIERQHCCYIHYNKDYVVCQVCGRCEYALDKEVKNE